MLFAFAALLALAAAQDSQDTQDVVRVMYYCDGAFCQPCYSERDCNRYGNETYDSPRSCIRAGKCHSVLTLPDPSKVKQLEAELKAKREEELRQKQEDYQKLVQEFKDRAAAKAAAPQDRGTAVVSDGVKTVETDTRTEVVTDSRTETGTDIVSGTEKVVTPNRIDISSPVVQPLPPVVYGTMKFFCYNGECQQCVEPYCQKFALKAYDDPRACLKYSECRKVLINPDYVPRYTGGRIGPVIQQTPPPAPVTQETTTTTTTTTTEPTTTTSQAVFVAEESTTANPVFDPSRLQDTTAQGSVVISVATPAVEQPPVDFGQPVEPQVDSQVDSQVDTQVVDTQVVDTQVDSQVDSQVDAQVDTQVVSDPQVNTQGQVDDTQPAVDTQVDPQTTQVDNTQAVVDAQVDIDDQPDQDSQTDDTRGAVVDFEPTTLPPLPDWLLEDGSLN